MEKDEIDEEIREPIPGEFGQPIPREIFFRELGLRDPASRSSRHYIGSRIVSKTFATKAVHTFCTKENVNRRKFKLPTGARTTFHMAFSPDGTKLASCHGDHSVYITDVRTGDVLQILCGHPRTPWCVVFHPTQNDILASGCLAGHVRVWDLNGGSEVLMTDSGTVIASLAFHPTVRLLAIATFNEIIFWDWNLPLPLARCSTGNTKEKVRLVRFDRLGQRLITGITNYPNIPAYEGLAASLASHRPNILSRRNNRDNFGPGTRRPDSNSDRDDGEGEPVLSPNGEIALAVSALAAVAEGGPMFAEEGEVSNALSHRQDRFQESYRQLVNHYQDLVNHYQQFLRSRIPRLLETSRIVREQPSPTTSQPSVESVLDSDVPMPEILEISQALPPPPPVDEAMSVDGEVPGPSRLIRDRITRIEARLLEAINSSSGSTDSTAPQEGSSSSSSSTAGTSRARSDTDLRSIEALAQNILEMQNLCSQARSNAPLTVETQHIIELQNIRRHLEVLQEQTRELQTSIRATLTSLARGSLDALRSHVTTSSNLLPSLPSTVASNISGSNVTTNITSGGGGSVSNASNNNNRNTVNSNVNSIRAPGTTSQNLTSSPSAVLRITVGSRPPRWATFDPDRDSGYHQSSMSIQRSQVPPEVTMQYDLSDLINSEEFFPPNNTSSSSSSSAANNNNNSSGSGGGTTSTLSGNTEPTPGSSRTSGISSSSNNSNNTRGSSSNEGGTRNITSAANRAAGPRRLVREYHVISGRGNSEVEIHARNCPFSSANPPRPPPRFPCLSDLGTNLQLTVWPTIESGIELETRNFADFATPLRRITLPNSQDMPRFVAETVTFVPNANNNNNNNNSQGTSTFSQWFNGGPHWMSNDVAVNVFLAGRLRLNQNLSTIMNMHENWQSIFPSGLAVIPNPARQGLRRDPGLSPRKFYGRPNASSNNNSNNNSGGSSNNSRSYYLRTNQSQDRVLVTVSSSSSLSGSSPSPSTSSQQPTITTPTLDHPPGTTIRGSPAPMPAVLEGNLTRIFFMRAGEEIIPVYSHLVEQNESSSTSESLEVRSGPVNHVYLLPVGLFLRGNSWENDTSTIGIYWPPLSRDEEMNLAEYRRHENGLVPIFTTSTRDSHSALQPSQNHPSNRRHRVSFNTSLTRISLQRGFWLAIDQPGMLVLSPVTTMANFPRPRPTEGILYLNFISPFLEGLERLFGYRQRNAYLSGSNNNLMADASRLNSNSMPHPPWHNQHEHGNATNNNNNNNNNSRSNSNSSGLSRRLLPGNNNYFSSDRPPPLDRDESGDSATIRVAGSYTGRTASELAAALEMHVRGNNPAHPESSSTYSINNIIASGNDNPSQRGYNYRGPNRGGESRERESYRRAVELTSRMTSRRLLTNRDHQSATRNIIRLAVDTVLDRDQQARANANIDLTRAIESRIERVLNERGNRGISDGSSPFVNASTVYVPLNLDNNLSPDSYSMDRQLRLEDLHMRISMLNQYSQLNQNPNQSQNQPSSRPQSSSVTSGTQTNVSFLQGGSGANNSASSSTSSISAAGAVPSQNNNTSITINNSEIEPPSSPPPPPAHSPPANVTILPSHHRARRRPYPRCTPPTNSSSSSSSQRSGMHMDDWEDLSPSRRIPRLDNANVTHSFLPETLETIIIPTPMTINNNDGSESSSPIQSLLSRQQTTSGNNEATSSSSSTTITTSSPLQRILATPTAAAAAISSPTTPSENVPVNLSSLASEAVGESWRERFAQQQILTQQLIEESRALRARAIPLLTSNDSSNSSSDNTTTSSSISSSTNNAAQGSLEILRNQNQAAIADIRALFRERVLQRFEESRANNNNPSSRRPVASVILNSPGFSGNSSISENTNESRLSAERVSSPSTSGQNTSNNNNNATLTVPLADLDSLLLSSPPSPLLGLLNDAGDGERPATIAVIGEELLASPTVNVRSELVEERRQPTLTLSHQSLRNSGEPATDQNQNSNNQNNNRSNLPGIGRSNRFRESIANSARTRALAALAARNATTTQNGMGRHTRARQAARSVASRSESQADSGNGGITNSSTRSNRPFSYNYSISQAARRQATMLAEEILGRSLGQSQNQDSGSAGSSSGSSANNHGENIRVAGPANVHNPRIIPHHHYFHSNNNGMGGDEPTIAMADPGGRFYPGYIPEILITPRARPPTYYTMDAATTAFLSSRIQRWDFSDFVIPDITNRTSGLIVSSCSLHSDATLDVSSDSEFIAVLQPSDNGSYSAVGIYSLKDESLGASLYVYHFDQNTVSVSISPSCDYIVVGYAGRGPFYRIVHPSRNIGQILSLTRYGDQVKLVPVKELVADNQTALVSVNCMHWHPVPGFGIIYGTNTGSVELIS